MRHLRSIAIVSVLLALAPCASGESATGALLEWTEPTDAVISPHVTWIKPGADGPLRVLFITYAGAMREVVELCERFEIDREVAAHHVQDLDWKPGRNYQLQPFKDADGPSFEKRLREKLAKEYDCIVIGDVPWKELPAWAREAILAKVAAGGDIRPLVQNTTCAGQLIVLRPAGLAGGEMIPGLGILIRQKVSADQLQHLDVRQMLHDWSLHLFERRQVRNPARNTYMVSSPASDILRLAYARTSSDSTADCDQPVTSVISRCDRPSYWCRFRAARWRSGRQATARRIISVRSAAASGSRAAATGSASSLGSSTGRPLARRSVSKHRLTAIRYSHVVTLAVGR